MAELDLKAGVSFSNTTLRRNWLCLSSACTVHRQPVCTLELRLSNFMLEFA